MKQLFYLLCITVLASSCNDLKIATDYQELPGNWSKDANVNFEIQAPDTTQLYNVFLQVRNDDTYAFSNLYVITDFRFPNGRVITDTLEYQMAQPDGRFLGEGMGTLKQNKLWYREGVRFRESGTYQLNIRHAMRENGSVTGINELEGIVEVGYSIEKQGNGKSTN